MIVFIVGQAGAANLAMGSAATLLIGFAIAILIAALLVKIVAASILGHAVRYSSAVVATFFTTLVQFAVAVVLVQTGIINEAAMMAVEQNPANADPLMPLGLTPFVATTLAMVVGLAAAIRAFVRGPDREVPSWVNAALSAIAVTVLMLALQYGVRRSVAIV